MSKKPSYYYTYTITQTLTTITRAGVGTITQIKKIIESNQKIQIKFLERFENFDDAMRYVLNLQLPLHTTSAVVCNETGRMFPNAQQAANYYHIAIGNMSKHLKGIRYRKTLNNLTFRRIYNEER